MRKYNRIALISILATTSLVNQTTMAFQDLGESQQSNTVLINANQTVIPPSTKTAIGDIANNKLVEDQIKAEALNGDEVSCADPNNPDSLANEQIKVIKDRQEIHTKSMDMRALFDVGKKNGCFAALSDFPDLSISIPSLSAIFDGLKQTLLKYAIRKVCNAVDDIIEDTIGPIKETLQKLSDDDQLDLTGAINKKMYQEIYDIDPDLGRVANPIQGDYETEIEFKW